MKNKNDVVVTVDISNAPKDFVERFKLKPVEADKIRKALKLGYYDVTVKLVYGKDDYAIFNSNSETVLKEFLHFLYRYGIVVSDLDAFMALIYRELYDKDFVFSILEIVTTGRRQGIRFTQIKPVELDHALYSGFAYYGFLASDVKTFMNNTLLAYPEPTEK